MLLMPRFSSGAPSSPADRSPASHKGASAAMQWRMQDWDKVNATEEWANRLSTH